MKLKSRVVVVFLLAMAAIMPSPVLAQWANKPIPTEKFHFDVYFHWGIIWKKAATATLATKKIAENSYHSELIGCTASWADKVFKVRDTLTSEFRSPLLQPVKYMAHSHEGKNHKCDLVEYKHSAGAVKVNYSRIVNGEEKIANSADVAGQVCDMVSMFHYVMAYDYSKFVKLETHTYDFFSGKEREKLMITFIGTETVKMKQSKKEYTAYHITLKFSKGGKKKSSDDIDVWLTTDGKNTPLILRGKMSVGEIRCFNSAK